MDLKRNLGRVVRRRRLELGFSQIELAERMACNVQQSDVSRIERGQIPWSRPDLLNALASALIVDPVELITQAGWMTPEELANYRESTGASTELPLAILGAVDTGDDFAMPAASSLMGRFRTLMTFDGPTLVATILSQSPELVVVHQDCPSVDIGQLEATIEENRLATNVIVVGSRRASVPRDLRFHYLKEPATPEALGSLLGAMGYV